MPATGVSLNNSWMISEGGTGEIRRINPHLNFGNSIENNNNIWKQLIQILT